MLSTLFSTSIWTTASTTFRELVFRCLHSNWHSGFVDIFNSFSRALHSVCYNFYFFNLTHCFHFFCLHFKYYFTFLTAATLQTWNSTPDTSALFDGYTLNVLPTLFSTSIWTTASTTFRNVFSGLYTSTNTQAMLMLSIHLDSFHTSTSFIQSSTAFNPPLILYAHITSNVRMTLELTSATPSPEPFTPRSVCYNFYFFNLMLRFPFFCLHFKYYFTFLTAATLQRLEIPLGATGTSALFDGYTSNVLPTLFSTSIWTTASTTFREMLFQCLHFN